jgi:hypothetical protein
MPTQKQEVLDRLSARGFEPGDYMQIKRIVSFDIPHGLLWFAQRFGRRSIAQVLAQLDRWKRFLEEDPLFTADEKGEVERLLSGIALVAWQALLDVDALPIGRWTITAEHLPTGQDEWGRPKYLRPGVILTAVHRDSNKKKRAVIPGEELTAPIRSLEAWKRAFEKLRIWDLVATSVVHKRVVSRRQPQGWPTFTQVVIPRLYEYLLPHYKRPGHYSEKRDTVEVQNAQFPKGLLEDMLLILRLEHPGIFGATTTRQLKADVQRHLERKRAHSTKLPK